MSMSETPGYDRIIQLSNEYREPVAVISPKLVDVSFIDDPGMRAVVVLALSLEWNMVHKANRVLTLIARNGFKHVIPTDTSVKFNVFQNRVYATITHSMTHIPTLELAEKIIKQCKLDPSHARVLRDAVTKMAMASVPEEEVEEPSAAALDEFVPTERVEPTLSTAAKGLQYVSQIMETVIRQLVPHGEDQITYRCMVCGLEFQTKRAVGGHYGNHVIKGEAEAKPEARDNAIRVTPTEVSKPEPEPEPAFEIEVEWTPPEPEPVAMRIEPGHIEDDSELIRLRDIISQVAALVSGDVARERDEALAELQDLRQKYNALQQTLSTLYELLGELNPTTKEK